MILLFGGTSETAGLADALAELGQPVLVSTATDADLDVGRHPSISRRCGCLDETAMEVLIRCKSVSLIVDASHPFARELHRTVAVVSGRLRIPCVRFQRQCTVHRGDGLFVVEDHQEAADLAASFAAPILLTTGSRNLLPYVTAARSQGVPLFVRVLPHHESEAACDTAGIPDANRIFARGPFSEEQNRDLIRACRIGVLVTKDSGVEGGVEEKLAAARNEDCLVVMIKRPRSGSPERTVCTEVGELVRIVAELLNQYHKD